MSVTVAQPNDIPALVSLLNSAYRGEESKRGWTTEANLIQGEERTDPDGLLDLIKTPQAVFLKYESDAQQITGCVFLHKKQDELYLGMLAVSPLLQAKGIGKQLLIAAEEHAKNNNCRSINMRVVSARAELIAWYERHGYYDTGKKEAFDAKPRFGIPVQPIEFIIMEKAIKQTV
jgi:ribosomal protein S18 acetylase RimI-like enzyme